MLPKTVPPMVIGKVLSPCRRSTGRLVAKGVICAAQRLDPANNVLRLIPLTMGGVGICCVLINRLASGIEPILLAASSQSRADVVTIFLSSALALTGLQWLALKPKPPMTVELLAEPVEYIDSSFSPSIVTALLRSWEAIAWATQGKCMVIFRDGVCVMHVGCMAAGHSPGSARPGPICNAVAKEGVGNYLANLALFPGRFEFFDYLPSNTQSLLVQPCGSGGVLLVASATQRGFTILDQAWILAWSDKIEVLLNSGTDDE